MSAQEVMGILISLTAISSYINYRFVKLPKSIGLTLITLLMSLLIAFGSQLGLDVDNFAQNLLDGVGFTDTFLHGMLGFLLFAGSLHLNTMELAKHKTIVALLATVSVVLSTFIIGLCTYGLTQFLNIPIPLEYCLVFGALISPTDAIAVLGVLKTANAPKSLEMKIAGEALFNDGMSIVLFVILLGLATGTQETWTVQKVTLFFLQQCVGGVLLGLVMGWLAARLLRTVDNYEVATILTLAVVAGGYTFSHSIAHVSGAICMTVSGLMVGGMLRNGKMSKDTLNRLDTFWELLDELLNAILFVLIGLEFICLTFTIDTTLAAIGAIVVTIAARWISVAVPVGCVSIFRKFSSNVVLMMTWGGVRGGISIALALTVPSGPVRDFVVAITYAVVLFSITVQGLTMAGLVRKLIGRELPQKLTEPGEIVHRPKSNDWVNAL